MMPVFESRHSRVPAGLGARPEGYLSGMSHPAVDPASTVPKGSRASRRGPREWARAFTGFYPPLAEDLVDLDPVARFLYSARSVILVISFQAALLAGLLALTDRRLALLPFALVLIGYVVLHAISNLSNDYFGARRGHDTEDSPRRRYTVHPLLSGAVSSRLLVRGLIILTAVAAAIGVYFVMLRGVPAVWLIVTGAVLLWAYDAAPRALKELGLGEIAAFVVWGPLMVAGGYFVIAGTWSRAALLASVPYGLGVMSILVGKHIDQRQFDERKHQRTLPVLLGERRARALNRAAVVGMYLFVVVGIALGAITPFALLVLLAAPRAVRAIRVMTEPAPDQAPAGYVGWPLWYHRVCLVHNRAFGWLYILGLAAGAVFPASRLGA
jgi:1,4-dihydroxy-2-naphthoate octaprenyltransferase